MYAQELSQNIEAAVAENDAQILRELLHEHYQKAETTDRPYDAAIELKPQYREALGPDPFEGDASINWANRIARAERLVAYRLKTLFGFAGTKIVEEGDSWFQYPMLLHDVIDNFTDQGDFAVYSLAAAGDLAEHMAVRREYHDALTKTGARVMLLSCGGNDLLGEGRIERLLRPHNEDASPVDLINADALKEAAHRIIGYYRQILTDVKNSHPDVTIFGHGYDTPFPIAGGRYFGVPFEKAGIPLDLGRDVLRHIVGYFGELLSALSVEFSNYRFIDLTGTVGNHRNSWDDELHPENAGFARAAKPLMEAVRKHIAEIGDDVFEAADVIEGESISPEDLHTVALDTHLEAGGQKTVVLDPGHGGTQSLPGASWNNAIGPSGSLEKRWTLDVCLRARPILEAMGHRVLMTRKSDVNLSGAARRNVARSVASDCFVAIHFNASTGHNAQGTETFVHTNTTSAKSIQLMHAIQASMVAALGHRDRNTANGVNGVLRANHSVTRQSGHHANTAACLHEVSFMDRVDEENRIQTASYRDRIANAIADGINAYLDDEFEFGPAALVAHEDGFDDAIHARAEEYGWTIPQYLGLAEAPVAALRHDGIESGLENASIGNIHIHGGMLPGLDTSEFSDRASLHSGSMVNAIYADTIGSISARTSSSIEEPDAGEDAFIDGSQGIDFSGFGKDPGRDRIILENAFSGLESTGFDYDAFANFIGSLNLRYFAPAEFLYLGGGNQSGGCAGRNGPPEKALWNRIANTARMIDEIRHRLGYPVRILSGYRNPSYNSCIGGVSGSLHMQFNALDWTCSSGSVDDWYTASLAVRGSNSAFSGGVGRYISKNFIHIDTRGTNKEWTKG